MMIARVIGAITTGAIHAGCEDTCCSGLFRRSALAEVSDGSWCVQQSVATSDAMHGCSSSMPAVPAQEATCDACICMAPGTQVVTADATTAMMTQAAVAPAAPIR